MIRRENGAIQIEFLFAVGVLLFPIAVFVLTIAPIVERRNVAGRAAAEAARAYAVAASESEALAAAAAIVYQIDANHSFELSYSVVGDFDRGGLVTATVVVTLPAIVFPGIGDGPGITYTATHQENIDLYRSLP